ncbi:MAG TPA: hypothetical protein VNO22_03885 [Planctomycetota bacterium]|nr:hypothetical protein [Planctomycetota bacterium]
MRASGAGAVGAVLAVWAGAAWAQEKGVPPGVDEERVDRAIRRGISYLEGAGSPGTASAANRTAP